MQPVSDHLLEKISQNLALIHDNVLQAHQRAGRTDPLPRLVAVTKYAELEWVRCLYALGEKCFGESRPQQLKQRAVFFQSELSASDIEWHLIGSLQRNKARAAIENAVCIHSIDSLRLLQFVERLAEELKLRPKLLLQVNISGEASKSGFRPEDLLSLGDQLREVRHAQISGLMTMAPDTPDSEVWRDVFRKLRLFRDELQQQTVDFLQLNELSMGMTHDYEVAVEEGATLIRVGSGLFSGCEELA